ANPAITSNRHYLRAAGKTIGILVSTGALPTLTPTQTAPVELSSVTLVKVEYWHKDHLGSLAATTDHAAMVTARYAYDPFGKRRYPSGTYDPFGSLVYDWSPAVNAGTDRGFTGHEHLDDLGLVHMNGRIYDASIGRFVQADPHITFPANLQNYDRYAYVLNDPLGTTDPTGHDSTCDEACESAKRQNARIARAGSICLAGCPTIYFNYPSAGGLVGVGASSNSLQQDAGAGVQAAKGVGEQLTDAARAVQSALGNWLESSYAAAKNESFGDVVSKILGGYAGTELAVFGAIGKVAKATEAEIAAARTASGMEAAANSVVPRLGSKGVDLLHHNANVTIRDAAGNIISHERVVSGNMSAAEKALGFPRGSLASHTEARAVRGNSLEAGQSMTITGQQAPCPSCKGAMNRAATESGATIKYQWRQDGATQVWIATPR
ncbi:MAG: RHS repeat-associated core domain-containing protein, partial [Fimbriimonadaceae bacterium]